ncbi:protein LAZ1 [Tanacetum coccineum]
MLHDQGNLHERVNRLRFEPNKVQKALDQDPSNSVLRDEAVAYVQAFNEAKIDEERFLSQKSFIGTSMACDDLNTLRLFYKKVSVASNANMICPIENDEIKRAMFNIGDDKAQGPDGYTSTFLKKGLGCCCHDVCNAIHDFFSNGQLLKEINHTFLALIPKVTTPLKVNDYWPISCCNVMYKCISKILTNRIFEGIKEVVSENQYAFVLGRRILDNILITQELMHNYHRNRGPPRAKEGYVKAILFRLIFSTSYGDLDSYSSKEDDLFIFARDDVESTKVIMDSLDEFKRVSGLVPSIPKSTTFFCNVLNHVKITILNIMTFSEGEFPIKYLGVRLNSSRLLNRDCKVLVEKARNRIGDWKNKLLSFAGRLQLCKSVISSMQVYWASVLVIPKGIISDIQQLLRGFLWCNDEYKRGKVKVTWDDICLPKHEGGLGLRSHIIREGYTIQSCVADLVVIGAWNWPQAWLLKAPNLALIPTHILDITHNDCMRWCGLNGNMTDFSVKCAWEVLCLCGNEVWALVRKLAGMDHVPPVLEQIMLWFQPMTSKRTVKGVVVMPICVFQKVQQSLLWDLFASQSIPQLKSTKDEKDGFE